MYTPIDNTQNYFFCSLRLYVETFEHLTLLTNQLRSTEVFKVVKPKNKKTLS